MLYKLRLKKFLILNTRKKKKNINYSYFSIGPLVPKVILMNSQTNQMVLILNNYTALETKYSAMAKPNIQLMQVLVHKMALLLLYLIAAIKFKAY